MKKKLKKIAMMLCALMITVGVIGGNVSEIDAASKVTCKYTLKASLGPAAGTFANSDRKYTVKLEDSKGGSITLGTATKSGSKYNLTGSSKFTMNKGETGKLRIAITGPDHQGKTRTWRSSSYITVSASTKSKTFTVSGFVDAPKFSIK